MTTGQPIKSHGDKLKYNNEFMENLQRQIKLNDYNLQANRTYQQTGQLPPSAQMYDTRTTAEKLGDYETIKRSIISDLSPVADPAFASQIITAVFDSPLNVDNKLIRFLAQNAPEIANQLSRKYKFGIRGDANDVLILVEFLEDAYNKTQNTMQSIKNYYNSTTQTIYSGGNGLLPRNNVELIKTELRDSIKKILINRQQLLNSGQPVSHELITATQDIIGLFREIISFLPDNDVMENILKELAIGAPTLGNVQDTGMIKREEIQYVCQILQDLPNAYSVANLITQLEKAIIKNEDGLVIDIAGRILNLFNDLYQEFTHNVAYINFRNAYIRRAEAERDQAEAIHQIQVTRDIKLENQAEKEARKAQRVYVINPEDDPVHTIQGGYDGGSENDSMRSEEGSVIAPPSSSNPSIISPPSSNPSIIAPPPPSSYVPSSSSSSSFPSSTTMATLLAGGLGMGGAAYAAYQYLHGGAGDSASRPYKYVRPDFDYDFPDEYVSPYNPSFGSSEKTDIPVLKGTKVEYPKKPPPIPPNPPSDDIIPPLSDQDQLEALIAAGGGGGGGYAPKQPLGESTKKPKDKELLNPQEKFKAKKDYLSSATKLDRSKFIEQNVNGLADEELYRLVTLVIQRENELNPNPSVNKSKTSDFTRLLTKFNDPSTKKPELQRLVKNILIGSKYEYDPQKGKLNMGIGGLGLRVKKGSGIYKPLGDIEVNNKNLEKGILTVRRKTKSNFMDLPSKHVSKNMTNIINQIIGGGVPSFESMNNLSEEEKNYLHKLISKSNLHDRLSVPAPSKDQMEKDFHQFEVLKGEILSGNDSIELVKKFKLLMMKLARQNLLPRNEVNELMEDLVSLGY